MRETIRVGLIGYGRAGQAVARVLGRSKNIALQWIAKRTPASEFEQAGAVAPIVPVAELATGAIFDSLQVDAVVDFSTASAVRKYGKFAAARRVTLITAISKYPPSRQRRLFAGESLKR